MANGRFITNKAIEKNVSNFMSTTTVSSVISHKTLICLGENGMRKKIIRQEQQ